MSDQHNSDIEVGQEVLRLEAAALTSLADGLGDSFSAAVRVLVAAKGRVICSGVGKSGHIARKIAATFSSTGTPAYFVHSTEASHGDLGMIQDDDVLLAISRSGDTPELDDLIQYSRRFGVALIAMTANPASALGAKADVVLAIPNAPEACIETNAPTTSTTMMMALGDALAVSLLRRRGFDAKKFKTFHPGGKLGAMLKTAADIMHVGDEIPLVGVDAPFDEALGVISEKRFGCVGVVDADGALVGVITDGDLRRLLLHRRTPQIAGEAMTRSPIALAPDVLAASVLQRMNATRITQVFIVEGARPVGLVHMHDILKCGVV